ncbi:hypothetical protein STAFG_2485 [Streptomyces afghaniensis 772]|uniref:Uncharacterized protein n=1 Tax=Streptomyces afghaniensis 772 TaxID=1283301 RepID=S4N1C3_9ACTN|nr:hypothetical protein STAFG_2485 [Streptomyces afghaniensis 772]
MRGGGVKLPRATARDCSCFASLDQQPLGGRHQRCAAVSQSPVRHRLTCTPLTIGQFRHSSTTTCALPNSPGWGFRGM